MSVAKKPVKYSLVDTYTELVFKGNPAAVCFLEEERHSKWLQSVAAEFNLSVTCYISRIIESHHNLNSNGTSSPRFSLRWFAAVTEISLWGHATLAAAYTSVKSLVYGEGICHHPYFRMDPPYLGILVSGIAPPGSGFDFYSRFFAHNLGSMSSFQDPVCGGAYFALAPYWSKKLGKFDFNAYQASTRGRVLKIHLDEQNQRVVLRGNAVTVMEGCVLV
ncbi:hypothetical protein Fmac_027949 [Flemingia macrophylla]|uniref:Uncharacterized protein n=1 Tax=Flemingia macrophylla TaxID=520843 RepID=A0ABD1LKU8_9FABA